MDIRQVLRHYLMCASAPRVKVPPVSGKSTRRPKANTMASKPVQIRKKMFGPNQYNTYCPVCFQKGVRSKVVKRDIITLVPVKGQKLMNKAPSAVLICTRDNGRNKPHDCGWRHDL